MTDTDAERAVETRDREETAVDHLKQFDHWTFLCAFGLVVINIVVVSRAVSIAAAALLAVSLLYDLYEFRVS
jgi:hypothetical protein